MEPLTGHFLRDCPPDVLLRILSAPDGSDLFLLRQVSRAFRYATDGRIRRIRPTIVLAPHALSTKFPNICSLDLTLCEEVLNLQRIEALVSALPRLVELFLPDICGNGEPTTEGPGALAQLTRLKLASWSAGPVSPSHDEIHAAVGMAARCCSLRRLHIQDSILEWEALQAAVGQLAGSLEELDLAGTFMQGSPPPRGFAALNTGRLRTLLGVADHKVGTNASLFMEQLAEHTSLTSLALTDRRLHAPGLEQLNSLKQLTRLELECSRAGPEDVAALRLPGVMALNLWGLGRDLIGSPPPDFTAALAGFSGLRALHVTGRQGLSARVPWAALGGLTALTTLYTDLLEHPAELRGLSRLRLLRAWESVAHESQLRHLSCLGSVTCLELSCHCGEEEPPARRLAWVPALTGLRALALIGFDDWHPATALGQVAALRALRALDLSFTRPPPPGALEPLARLQLDWLCLPEGVPAPEWLRVPFLKGLRQPSFADLELPDLAPELIYPF